MTRTSIRFVAAAHLARALLATIVLLLAIFRTSDVAAAGADNIQKNPIDLRTSKFFSRPITELELILLNMKAQAEQSASFMQENPRLHVIKTVGMQPEGRTGFDPSTGRVFLTLELHVDEMSDPWRAVCDSAISSFYGWFFFPPSDADERTKLALMAKYLGEAVRLDRDDAAEAVNVLIKSIAIQVTFLVVDSSSKALTWMRTCTKDNLTGKTFYTEYQYH